ncbi:MAG: NAD(P)/FAD-dependent oxidoreductase [Kofleriaceae bacterium]
MDTKSGYPFWVIKNGLLPAYPVLERDTPCDVLVIGGGITGALVADHLSRHGHDALVVEQRDVGWGSTAASTALVQYEIDTHMTELAARYSEPIAALAYTTCASGVEQLSALAKSLGDCGFLRTDSVYLASSKRDTKKLVEEQSLRARHGVPSAMWSAPMLEERLGLRAPGALHTRCAAVLDPYRFTCRLLARAHRRGVAIYDRTSITELSATPRGVTARTSDGVAIRARHAIIAAGYESQRWLRARVARNRSSYACISDPIKPARLRPLAHAVIWETARPYHYVRTTNDHRILVGGEDDAVDVPARRDRRVEPRARALEAYLGELLPEVPFRRAFAWGGTFAETRDGLPYFGAHPERGDRVLFAMAYGGNGITYSLLGATVLRALIERRTHPLVSLYGFARGGGS